MTLHTIKFYRDQEGFSAHCTCGWGIRDDDKETVQARAATHDLDEWDETPVPKHVDFKSGLS
jgi:hypothetical protein